MKESLSDTYPDGTSESWTYDATSNVASHTDGKSQTVTYGYDNAGQLTTVTYPAGTGAGTGISYTYDVAGRKTGMTDVSGTSGYTFDNANRLTSLLQPNATTGYGYDNANRRTSMTVSGVTGSWTYTYDNADRLATVLNPSSETATYGYDNANRVTSLTAGNSSVTSYGYDNANRSTDVWHKTSGGVTLGRYQYSYDGEDNVLTRTDNDGSVTTFGYDNADQLTSEVRSTTGGGSNAYSISYTYDHNANRKTKVIGGVTDNYTYDSNDKLLSTSSKTYGYDLNGNCTSVKVGAATPTTLTYDIENRVTGISYPAGGTNSFVYNGDDLRTKKTDSAGTKTFKTDGSSPANPVLSDGAAIYTPGLSERKSTTSSFYHSDALGSTRGITGSTQTATDSTLYDGFGMTVSRTGTNPTPFGFVGASQYQTDGDSGLQLLGHRYYDPSIGRFLSQDPIQDGSNWYAYADNNPLAETDPEGLQGGRGAPPKPPKQGKTPPKGGGPKPNPGKTPPKTKTPTPSPPKPIPYPFPELKKIHVGGDAEGGISIEIPPVLKGDGKISVKADGDIDGPVYWKLIPRERQLKIHLIGDLLRDYYHTRVKGDLPLLPVK